MEKITLDDIIATNIVRDIYDSVDQIKDCRDIRSISEAVFESAPDVFPRSLDHISVDKITPDFVHFKYISYDFTIERDGVIRQQSDIGEYPKAKLKPMFIHALNEGLNYAEQKQLYDKRFEHKENQTSLESQTSLDSKISKDSFRLDDSLIL